MFPPSNLVEPHTLQTSIYRVFLHLSMSHFSNNFIAILSFSFLLEYLVKDENIINSSLKYIYYVLVLVIINILVMHLYIKTAVGASMLANMILGSLIVLLILISIYTNFGKLTNIIYSFSIILLMFIVLSYDVIILLGIKTTSELNGTFLVGFQTMPDTYTQVSSLAHISGFLIGVICFSLLLFKKNHLSY